MATMSTPAFSAVSYTHLLFKAYAFEMNFEISCNNEKIVSGATAKIANTNGAHPNTVKDGFTYDKASGKEMALTDVMVGTQAEIQAKVIAEFEKKIDANTGDFLEGAKDSLQKEIANVEFYMAKDGIHFFFQLYTIAPYAAGFQEVVFPYADGVTVFVPAAETEAE